MFKRGNKGDKMYFIVRGIVDILTTEGFVATSLTDGSHFGGKDISFIRVCIHFRFVSGRLFGNY